VGTSDIFVGHVVIVFLFVFFSHSNRDLLRATAVTPKWNGYQNKSQYRKLTGEEKPRTGNRSDEILLLLLLCCCCCCCCCWCCCFCCFSVIVVVVVLLLLLLLLLLLCCCLLLLLLLFVCFGFLFVFKALLQQGLYKSTCHHRPTLN